MTYEERKYLCARHATLDGERATISGARMSFAMIRSLESSKQVEFSWQAVQRIVNTKHGEFKS